jgi:hypothetical protein
MPAFDIASLAFDARGPLAAPRQGPEVPIRVFPHLVCSGRLGPVGSRNGDAPGSRRSRERARRCGRRRLTLLPSGEQALERADEKVPRPAGWVDDADLFEAELVDRDGNRVS